MGEKIWYLRCQATLVNFLHTQKLVKHSKKTSHPLGGGASDKQLFVLFGCKVVKFCQILQILTKFANTWVFF